MCVCIMVIYKWQCLFAGQLKARGMSEYNMTFKQKWLSQGRLIWEPVLEYVFHR